MGGHRIAFETLQERSVDCIIAVGASFGEFATSNWNSAALNQRLIHVDTNPEHFSGSHMAQLQIQSSPLQVFDLLEKLLAKSIISGTRSVEPKIGRLPFDTSRQRPTLAYSTLNAPVASLTAKPNCNLDEPEKYFSDAVPIKPQRLMGMLPTLLPPGTRFIADGTGANFWAIHYLHVPDRRLAERRTALDRRSSPRTSNENRSDTPRRHSDARVAWTSLYRCPGEFGSMGWGPGAAIGAAFGNPGKPVVVLTGDGSMLMNGQEITVALQQQLTVIFVVLNDRALGTVKHGQRLEGAEPIGFELPEVDFAAMAKAMGIESRRIHSPSELLNVDLAKICEQRKPYLLDVLIDPEEMLPLGGRMKALEASP
jgi:acetolactate synthase-1/2/3 large subunit